LEIKILSKGCEKGHMLEQNVKKAVDQKGVYAKIIHIKDSNELIRHGINETPALLINDSLIAMGEIPDPEEIQIYLD